MKEYLWTEQYRPQTIQDCILPTELKQTLLGYVENQFIPNLIFAGRSGVGKTTAALALFNQLDVDWIKKNASLEGIEMLRTDIATFASSVSFKGKRKYVLLDEADNLTHATQQALRTYVEDYASNCGFIFTCNNPHLLKEALQSRAPVIEFSIPKDQRATLAKEFLKRATNILDLEGVAYNKEVIIELITKNFPDWRRIIGELQRYAKNDRVIDVGLLANGSDLVLKELIGHLRNKSFTQMRKMIAESPDIDHQRFYRKLYDGAYDYFSPTFVPQLVVMIRDAMRDLSMSVDPEIALVAFLTLLMTEAVWKDK